MEKVEVLEVMKAIEVESCYSHKGVATPKKRKSKVHEDGVEKPKKPRSAYMLYYFDVHQIMQQKIPTLPQSEINKRISESWKKLSVAEKGYYLEKAKSEKEGIDTSLSPSKELPGFRKILPRSSYFLLPKGSSSNNQPGDSQPEGGAKSSASPVDRDLPSVSLSHSPPFTPLGLASEVELSEQPIVFDDVAEETTVSSHPSSSSVPFKTVATVSQVSPDLTEKGFSLQGNEARSAGSCYSGAMVQQIQGETAHVVTIIPTQKLLEPKSVVGVSPVGQVMMVSVGANMEQKAKPSYKMPEKTYTRRGRGRCLHPGCSFVYVTRHKPPTCPDCGSHLGGKWISVAKKTPEKYIVSKHVPQNSETKPNESVQPTPPTVVEGNSDVTKSNSSGTSRKLHVVQTVKPPEGSSTKEQEQTKQVNEILHKGMAAQDTSNVIVQKRPVRPILPAYYGAGRPLFQIITIPPDKGKLIPNDNKYSTGPHEGFSGLKPSTLKQLGKTVTTTATKQVLTQDSSVLADESKDASSLADGRVNVLSVVPYKQRTAATFDLGLSTARGWGHCKNPLCDHMYKNRYKPAVCPKCGCELPQKNPKGAKSVTLLDPHQALSPAQREVQRQSTLQLLQQCLQIPESQAELQETLSLIQELNNLQIVLVQPGDQELHQDGVETETLVQSGWPQFYESAATHCGLCCYPLFKGDQSTVAGQEDCWLLTETLIQTASLQLKVCLNIQCLALHSFTDLHPGLFNVGNRLLVSIDLFLKIRASVKLGQPPSQAARSILDHNPNHSIHSLSPEEFSQIEELLLSGYWAFESLTVRDYNDAICGICGVAPKLEIAQRYTDNVLELKNIEFTWPEFSVPDEVHVDDFWLTMESEAIEQATFPTDIPITRVDASIIAPFIPTLMRSNTVINTEKDKVLSHTQQPSGNPSVLVRLIHDGQLRLDKIEDHSEDELRTILERCGASINQGSSKNELLASLISLYTLVHSGLSTAPQPPPHLTAGKLSMVCPHKVVCGSKCLVRGETARDHVDLLLSSRFWPPVYVSDCPRQVALCMDTQYPQLATEMWGRNQGCFSDPFEKPEFVSCAELQEHPYSGDLSLAAESQQVHPITKSSSCWLVHPPDACKEPASLTDHHSMSLCRDLEPHISLITELEKKEKGELDDKGSKHKEQTENANNDSLEKSEENSTVSHARRQPVIFNNMAYYYLYNRLVDFLTSRDIVSQQINQVVKACQPGEVVIRDALYRLGVAHIDTERDEQVGSGTEGQAQEAGIGTYEVVLL